MIHVDKRSEDCPPILDGEPVQTEVRLIKAAVEREEAVPTSELKRHFAHSSVLAALSRNYRERCAFCESEGARDIHHYRPMSRYPWLAYDWANLLLACPTCSRTAADQFPLPEPDSSIAPSDVKKRLNSWTSEKPLLLQPELDRPDEHLEVWHDGTLRRKSERGQATIDTFRLNREELIDARWRVIDDLMARLRSATDAFVAAMRRHKNLERLPNAFHQAFVGIFQDLNQRANGEQPYSLVARNVQFSPGRFLNARLGPDSSHRHIAYAAFQKFVRDDPQALTDAMFRDAVNNELRASMSSVIARWQSLIDPAVQRVFVVTPDAPDLEASRAGHIVVVRADIQEQRMPEPWQEIRFLDLPAVALDDALDGRLDLPPGFARDRWRELDGIDDRPAPIKIDRVSLHNFRCFTSLEVAFHPGINVVIGKNGAGKTAILDALANTLAQVINTLFPAHGQHGAMIGKRDIRVAPAGGQTEVQTDERQYPARIRIPLVAYGDQTLDEYSWEANHENGHESHGTGPISFLDILDMVRWSAQTDHQVPLPVFAYYRTTRTVISEAPAERPTDHREQRSRLAGYLNWHRSAANLPVLEQWFQRMQLLEHQRGGEPLGVLQTARQALLACLKKELFEEVRYDANVGALAARQRAGPWLSFDQLSDGVRNTLGLVADLAVRCAQLNPHLGERAALETSGVVLIDELDLHLHPTWQSHVIGDLRAVFPNVQFIITTHSPLLISSLRPDEVLILERDDQDQMAARHPTWDPRLLTGNELFQRIFGVDDRPPDPLFREVKRYEYLARSPYRTDDDERQLASLGEKLRAHGVSDMETPVPREPLPEDM